MTHQAPAVHALLEFPLRVTLPGGQRLTIRDAHTLTGVAYTAMFTPDTICAIERGALNDAGERVTIGKDVVVAERTGGTLKVTELRVIGPAAEPDPGVRATLDLRFKGASRQVAGNLANDQIDKYLVSMTKGGVLQGRLERFRGADAVLRVFDPKGQPVDTKADGRRTWAGSMPSTGTYRVEVVRKAPYCDPPLTYLLTLGVR